LNIKCRLSHPLLIERLNSRILLMCLHIFLLHSIHILNSSFIGLVVNGFINVVITTIERRFGLQSRKTGFIASGKRKQKHFYLINTQFKVKNNVVIISKIGFSFL
jgi:hypothetical protein